MAFDPSAAVADDAVSLAHRPVPAIVGANGQAPRPDLRPCACARLLPHATTCSPSTIASSCARLASETRRPTAILTFATSRQKRCCASRTAVSTRPTRRRSPPSPKAPTASTSTTPFDLRRTVRTHMSSCTHLDQIGGHAVVDGLRRLPRRRAPRLGAPARVPELRSRRLLRQLARSSRDRALQERRSPDHPIVRTGRRMVLVLRRRVRVRARRRAARAVAPLISRSAGGRRALSSPRSAQRAVHREGVDVSLSRLTSWSLPPSPTGGRPLDRRTDRCVVSIGRRGRRRPRQFRAARHEQPARLRTAGRTLPQGCRRFGAGRDENRRRRHRARRWRPAAIATSRSSTGRS